MHERIEGSLYHTLVIDEDSLALA